MLIRLILKKSFWIRNELLGLSQISQSKDFFTDAFDEKSIRRLKVIK